MISNSILRTSFVAIILIGVFISFSYAIRPEALELSGKIEIEDNIVSYTTAEETILLYLIAGELVDSQTFPLDMEEDYILSAHPSEKGFIVYEIKTVDGEQSFRSTDRNPIIVSFSPELIYTVEARRCISCRLCINSCPVGAIRMVRGVAVIDQEKCISCGICIEGNATYFEGCPVEAVLEKERE
ncbi:MAG: 4Fe-4S binding protein [Candidatus Cloacimonetes bacterium]|nr:4Fe-4S binding protein [Candidatus Cloacimonadota bacterium]